ncbi:MAG: PLxRFG domain-containing protein, partial [Desulfofustis sp.]|nr:PLxRFG domain-containing protein [Desulfofustis sp.]
SGLTDALNDMDTDLKTADKGDQTLMGEIRNELVKRDEAINNPNIHPAAQFLTSLGFVWNIGPSIASGIVNMTQTPLVTGPYLAARYGAGKARQAIIKASADYARKSKFDKDHGFTLQDSKDITADEKKMFQELVDQGVIDVTQAHDLAAAAGTDYLNMSGSKRMVNYARAMKIISWPFHVTELANRQVSSLAAYRLAREAGKDHAAAVEVAGKAVMDTHFDYSQENRARHMQGNVARVILLFKQYSQNMTFLLGRSLHQALKGENEEVKRIARAQLYGIVGGHFLVSGALGMPFIGVAGGALNMLAAAFGDDDEPWEWDVELRNYLADTVGKDIGEAVSHGPLRLVMPFDVAGRLSLSDLWYRKPSRELEGRAAFQQQLQNILGPTASNAGMWYSGATAIADGEVLRGLEMMMPKAVKDVLKTGRYADEGVRNWKDDVLIEELTALELAGQIIGFTPRRVSEMYESKNAILNTKTKIETRRSKLLNKMVQARIDRDSAEVASVQRDINDFNRANPDFELTWESVYRSMQNRKRIRENTKGGTYLPETKAGMRDYGRFANMD